MYIESALPHAFLNSGVYVMSTYCVHFVVFVFSIDVFNICNNVGVQCLWRGGLF